jgi:hypothetical protein
MPDRLFVGVLGHRNSGKTTTWKELFGHTVKTGSHPRKLELRPKECVEVFLVSGSFEERGKYAGKVLKDQKARIVLCSMQYVEEVRDTIAYAEEEGFWSYVQWLNPGYKDAAEYPDYLGIGQRLLFNSGAALVVRDGKSHPSSRVRELREFIYGWATFRKLIVEC